MKIYAENLEQTALEQFEDAMKQDYVVDGALMPDAHTGYSLPIGAVVSTKDYIVPSWVGYDIGCGMCALKLDGITRDAILDNKDEIFDEIYKHIPVGFNTNSTEIEYNTEGLTDKGKEIATYKKHTKALGSLGGGNHFIEIGHDENDVAWVIIHSGSRGVGHGIGSYYMKLAKIMHDTSEEMLQELGIAFDLKNVKWKDKNPEGYKTARDKYISSNIPKSGKNFEGHFGFDINSMEGKDYINDLNWSLEYALANRKEMIDRIVAIIRMVLDKPFYNPNWDALINRNHNHAVLKDGLWIHRKGATQAEFNMEGVIPGNMLHGSFIVRGKGNPESLYSSSHGAGRVLGRKEANRVLDLNEYEDMMKDVKGKVDASTLDESPLAYKNIFEVMELQKDLVEVVHHIKPLVNIKG